MSSIHTSHPKCKSCGRALFKGTTVGSKVKPSDPYQYCRNAKCAEYCAKHAPEQDAPKLLAPDPPKGGPASVEVIAKTERPLRRRARPASDRTTKPQDSSPVATARARIRMLVAEGDPAALGLTLALLNQEVGNQAAANALIDEYKLDEKFGLNKWG